MVLEMAGAYSEKITVATEKPKKGIEQYSDFIKLVEKWEAQRLEE
jgi:hypothetical protein